MNKAGLARILLIAAKVAEAAGNILLSLAKTEGTAETTWLVEAHNRTVAILEKKPGWENPVENESLSETLARRRMQHLAILEATQPSPPRRPQQNSHEEPARPAPEP